MMEVPDIWIRLKPLSSAVPIDTNKQAALQSAHRIFSDFGLYVRNGEMTDWSVNLGQPEDWPLTPIGTETPLCWEPIGVVFAESAIRKAAAYRTDAWAAQIGYAARLLLEAGLLVRAEAPGAKCNIGAIEDLMDWIDFVIAPHSRRTSQRCLLGGTV